MLQSFTSTGDTLDAVGLGFLAYELANPSDPADDELIIRAVNEHASLLTGLDFDNLIGASINEKLPSVRAAGLSPIYARVARSGVSETIEQVRLTIEPMAGQIFRVKVLGLAPNIGGLVFDNITERVLAAERIRFQSRLLDAVEQVVIATDAEGRVTYWNPAAERLFRVPAEQAVGAIIWEISLTPEQSRRLTESVLRGEKIAGSFTTQVRGGETIVVQVTASPFRGPQDEVAGMVLVAVDVTARVRAEETVRENERRMRALVKALPDAVLRLSRAGIVIEASRPLDGISYPNPVGTDVRIAAMEFLSPAHGAAIHAALDRALAGKSVQTVEFDITHAGATHHLEARLVADGEDDIVAILRNVTQRRRMELQLLASRNDLELRVQARTAELRQVNEALRTLIDGSPFAIASCDAEGRLRSWNRAAERMFGYTAAEVMGLVVPILPEAEQEAFLERVRKLLDDPAEQIDVLDRVYRHKNGSPVYGRVTVAHITSPAGRPAGLIAFIEDVTNEHHAREAAARTERQMALLRSVTDAMHRAAGVDEVLAILRDELQPIGIDGGELVLDLDGPLGEERFVWTRDDVPYAPEDYASVQEVAVVSRRGMRGRMQLVSRTAGLFDDDLRRLVCVIGSEVGVAVENIVLFRNMRDAMELTHELSHRIATVRESERRQLGLELHDHLGQSLTALKFSLEAGSRAGAPATEHLRTAAMLVADIIAEVRNVSLALRQPLFERGLFAEVTSMCEQFARDLHLDVRFDAHGSDSRLPHDLELTLFRVIQEALTNVARHAGAGTASVRLDASDDAVRVRVEDEGRGFRVDHALEQQTGGLAGIIERVTLAGGEVIIDSKPGGGTRIDATLPREVAG